MTELEYVLENFEQKLSCLRGKRILIHGSREYAAAIIDHFRSSFSFIGVMSFDAIEGMEFHGLPVFQKENFETLCPEAVLLTERIKYAEEVYQGLHLSCERRGIFLYNMYGLNELETHREIEHCKPQSMLGWRRTCMSYDLVAFEAMDTFLTLDAAGKLSSRPSLEALVRWLLSWGTDVKFSLRKSFSEELQVDALNKLRLCSDLEDRLIRRRGEDLSFRQLRESHSEKRILYIGTGLVNECLLPRCYGIDTYRFSVYIPQVRPKYWQDWHMPVGDMEGRRISFDAKWEERVRQQIMDSDLVSFDVFDTLLIRRTLTPWDVFELVEQRGKKQNLPTEQYAVTRKATGESMPCANIYEIYGRLREKLGWSEEQTQDLLELELGVEREVIIPRKKVAELFFFARQKRKRVILTSDMYLPGSILSGILNDCGISGYETLLISCDIRREKRSGLFEELLRLNGNREGILHIGDSIAADDEPCRKLDIRTVMIPSPISLATSSAGWKSAVVTANTLMERCLVGLCVSELFQNPFQNPNLQDRPMDERLRHFAGSVIGPLSIGFLTWLMKEFHNTPLDGVLFMARDGHILWQIYQGLQKKYKLPSSIYFYTSRHAAFLCCADDEENIPWIVSLGNYTGISDRQKLTQIYELREDQILQRKEDEPETDYIRRHMHDISEVAENEREAVITYTGLIGLKEKGNYAVVDSMAAGTAQWFMESWMPYQFQGFYLGNCSPGNRKSKKIRDYLEFQNDSLLKNYIEIENFFTSPEPSVRKFSSEGKVLFAEDFRSREELAELRFVQEEALRLAEIFFTSFYVENEVISSAVPEEMFAADGCHWVQQSAYDDWTGSLIPTKSWDSGRRIDFSFDWPL